MPSSPEPASSGRSRRRDSWNSRVHYYAGLYFLFFLWLFAVSGLLLNHGMWGSGGRPGYRSVSKAEFPIKVADTGNALIDAQDYMRQLGLEGEVQWFGTTADATRFMFRVARPGRQAEVRVDRSTATAVVERAAQDTLGVVRAVHVFTGVRLNDARNERDWIVTTVWALAMDAVAAGLIAMVVTGIVIWWRSGAERWPGLLVLGAGLLCCAWFVAGVARFAVD